jgi:hypothetical protein
MTQAMKYGYEIRIVECKEFLGGLPDDSFKETIRESYQQLRGLSLLVIGCHT